MRSLLFVPGDSARKLEKALPRAPTRSSSILRIGGARRKGRGATGDRRFLGQARRAARPLFVRVNGLTTGLIDADLDGVMASGPDGIVLPKTEGGSDVSHLGAKLAVHEAVHGLADGSTRILAIATETARRICARLSPARANAFAIAWGGETFPRPLERKRTAATTAPMPSPIGWRVR